MSRDTAYVPAKENIFDETYMESRKNNFILDLTNLINVPYSNSTYNINAGQIEKGNVTVQVFEISAIMNSFKGLDAENKSYNLDELLKVGSMTEASEMATGEANNIKSNSFDLEHFEHYQLCVQFGLNRSHIV